MVTGLFLFFNLMTFSVFHDAYNNSIISSITGLCIHYTAMILILDLVTLYAILYTISWINIILRNQ